MSRTPLVQLDQPLADAGAGDELRLPSAERHHLTTVLRLRDDDPLEVTDGAGRLAAGVLTAAGVRLAAAPVHHPAPRPSLRVVHALPKGRKLDEVVRVLVELGVDEVQPVTAARSVRRPEGDRAAKAVERWAAVCRSACEQARRLHRARIAPIVGMDELDVAGPWLLAHPRAELGLPAALAAIAADGAAAAHGAVTLAVGPEGGWDDAEVARLTGAGATAVHLGPTVLRTEHAAAAAVAVASAWLGRWDASGASL